MMVDEKTGCAENTQKVFVFSLFRLTHMFPPLAGCLGGREVVGLGDMSEGVPLHQPLLEAVLCFCIIVARCVQGAVSNGLVKLNGGNRRA